MLEEADETGHASTIAHPFLPFLLGLDSMFEIQD